MSKKLAKLLDKPVAEITKAVAKLEKANANPSEDVRLLAENKQSVRIKTSQLGLDPDDTSSKELYWALRARYDKDSQALNRALGVSDSTSFNERLHKADQLINLCAATDEAWLLKNSSAKKLLTANPPKQTAKKLHYRSTASMLKREDVSAVFLAAETCESATWQKNIAQAVSKLGSSDYELRPLKVIKLPNAQWQARDPNSYLVLNKTVGAAAILPSQKLERAPVLSLTLLLLGGLQALNPEGYSEALHELSPALRWWSDTRYLVSDGKNPVSFNLKDVTINHINDYEAEDGVKHHAAQSLWDELTNRYQAITDSLSDSIPETEYNFNELEQSAGLPKAKGLAPEYITVE